MSLSTLKVLVLLEWILSAVYCLLLLAIYYSLKTSRAERLIRIISLGMRDRHTIVNREDMQKALKLIKPLKARIMFFSGMLLSFISAVWILSEIGYMKISLTKEIFLLSIMGVILIPITFVLVVRLYGVLMEVADNKKKKGQDTNYE